MSNKDESPQLIDIREDDLMALSAEVLSTLLRDHTTGRNIFWATHDYEALGSEYGYHSEILPHLITGERGMVVRPRVLKSKEQQTDRAKDMAEVFTPSWVCNAQNNLVDEAWFGRKDVFNVEVDVDLKSTSRESGISNPLQRQLRWKAAPNKIEFPERLRVDEHSSGMGKTWKDYVRATRMEMACGEAPYLVSRYDATTGEPIPLEQRIGCQWRMVRMGTNSLQKHLRLRMAGRQPATGPRSPALDLHRILSGEVWQGSAHQEHQLHCLHHFLEPLADGRSERRRARQLQKRRDRENPNPIRRGRADGTLYRLSARRHPTAQRHLLPYP